MKTFRKFILVTLIAVATIIIIFFALFFLNKDFQEFVLSSIYEEETIYAKGYSDEEWKKVKTNDSIDSVVQLLGKPLKIYKSEDGSFSYYYTYQGPKDTNYRMRVIFFNKEGKVIEKYREFYID
jgi:hypothetical protein